MIYRFRGATTQRMYAFMNNPLSQGQTTIVIAGETCVPTTDAGELARGIQRGPVPANDIYGFVTLPSPWMEL